MSKKKDENYKYLLKFVSMSFENFETKDTCLLKINLSVASRGKATKTPNYYLVLLVKDPVDEIVKPEVAWFANSVNTLAAGITKRKAHKVCYMTSAFLCNRYFAFIKLTKKDYEAFARIPFWKAPGGNSFLSLDTKNYGFAGGSSRQASWVELDLTKIKT